MTTALNSAQLRKLEPYVSNFLDSDASLETARGKLKIAALSGTQAVFSIDGVDPDVAATLLSKIRDACYIGLTQRIIVPQPMPPGATINHRPMEFEVKESHIVVKYKTLGSNTFETAMEYVARIYPGVSV